MPHTSNLLAQMKSHDLSLSYANRLLDACELRVRQYFFGLAGEREVREEHSHWHRENFDWLSRPEYMPHDWKELR